MSETSKWTAAQAMAIAQRGNALVSAAAGSGKTAVLSERCAALVCDPKNPCGIDQLLVVTFNESAAAGMKSRIHEALSNRLNKTPGDWLKKQIALAEGAHVSTLHAFCSRLIRRNFNLAGIDPQFVQLNQQDSDLMKVELATEIFERMYDRDESGDFHRLIDDYADGDDKRMIAYVISGHGKLCSLPDPRQWMKSALAGIRKTADEPLTNSIFGGELLRQIRLEISGIQRQLTVAREAIRKLGQPVSAYVRHIDEDLAEMPRQWMQILDEQGLDALVECVKIQWETIEDSPRIKSDVPNKEIAAELLKRAKDTLRANGRLAKLLICNEEQWQAGMRDILPHATAFLKIVGQFSVDYNKAKAELRALDFFDLERKALEILSEKGADGILRPSAVARELHKQFQYVLVDEYQDINEIQDTILYLASRDSSGNRPGNLFCVGDIKQSIYRFRLAEPNRFLNRQQDYQSDLTGKHGTLIHLQENFRSREPLLEAINSVFERMMTAEAAEIEYDDSHRLRAGRQYPSAKDATYFSGAPIEFHLLHDDLPQTPTDSDSDADGEELERGEYEALLLARRIHELMGKAGKPRMNVMQTGPDGQMTPRPIEYKDIVILMRALKFKADLFTQTLQDEGITVYNESGTGFFNTVEIRDVICLLNILDNQQQEIPLAAFLRGPLAGIARPEDALTQIRLAYPGNESLPVPFHQAAANYARQQTDELGEQLRSIFARLADWRDQANKRPVAELIWHIYDQTGFLAYCSGLTDGPQRVANLLKLHEYAREFDTFLRQSLWRFLRFVENLREKQDIALPPLAGGENAVRIMSIHKAKGLEFPVVLLPDLGKKFNLRSSTETILLDRQWGLGMEVVDPVRMIRYPSLASRIISQNIANQTLAEEMRLLYVAMTRAREHLILVGTRDLESTELGENSSELPGGKLSVDAVLNAKTPLDWLCPVAAAIKSASGSAIEIIPHAAAEIADWQHHRNKSSSWTPHQQQLAELQPLNPAPQTKAEAERLIKRFQSEYSFSKFTGMPASISVTTLAKRNAEESAPERSVAKDLIQEDSADEMDMPAPEPYPPPPRVLDLPKFFREAAPKPADIGTATHAMLEHWDFADGADGAIERQIAAMVDRGLLLPEQEKMVDRAAIGWLLGSELGGILKANAAKLLREIPFTLAVSQPDMAKVSNDSMDQLMVRGRIDLVIPTADGLIIVDYKTDNVSRDSVDERIEAYRKQMLHYRHAVEVVAGQPVAEVFLVFLRPRMVITV